MIRAAARSVANVCIFPMQDVLHLGSEARMNTPSAGAGNWTWRYGLHDVHPDFAVQLAALMEMTDRDGYEKPVDAGEAGKTVGVPYFFRSTTHATFWRSNPHHELR